MRSHRGGWLGSSILAAVVVLLPAAASTVRAQPGFGPDPFWPYNSQYAPYTTSMGPADPRGGQGGPPGVRDGLRGANQYQNYLDSLEGPGRNSSDRSGIGMPYYRSAVDPAFENRERTRQYQPNSRNTERTTERPTERLNEPNRRVTDMYFEYYSERDPRRRAQILRDYRESRRDFALAVSGRGRLSSRNGSDTNRRARSGSADAPTGRFGPAPEIPAFGRRRSSTAGSGSGSSSRRSLPSDILERSQAMDREGRGLASPGSPGPSARSRATGRRSARPAAPLPPGTDDGAP